MSIAIYLPKAETTSDWCKMLGDLLPGWRIEAMDAVQSPEEVTFAVVWRPQAGDIARFPNLKAIVSVGAGIDHVLADPKLPKHVPIIRTVGADLTQRMREYIALHVLRHHRNMPRQLAAQTNLEWDEIVVPVAPNRTVGVMGLGNLGRVAAETISALGFNTVGWARSPKTIPGITTFSGQGEFRAFLQDAEILVNLLPLTGETEGILNSDLFEALPKGACVINAARGQHLADQDLLDALESGQIAQATLDVFHQEPLPTVHPFWRHPQITITPHIASRIDAGTGSKIIAANIKLFDETGTVPDLADAARGY